MRKKKKKGARWRRKGEQERKRRGEEAKKGKSRARFEEYENQVSGQHDQIEQKRQAECRRQGQRTRCRHFKLKTWRNKEQGSMKAGNGRGRASRKAKGNFDFCRTWG